MDQGIAFSPRGMAYNTGKIERGEELQIKNICSLDVVTVVGEPLPTDFPSTTGKVTNPDALAPEISNTIPTQGESGLLARRLSDQKCNIQLLHSCLNRIREILPLPNDAKAQDRIFYYHKFTMGVDNT
ncbi:hypothetical protein FBEOM_12914 [Fusarium beomiforme]|uniref:Uncharacterized protein n=1 Tax=Fusarium beomiforme TaxID=44412 RepID=A0A9P5A6P6_9HYPO|nr:hypothetical protein FBEOM_12914 [Fusarium beomiforme]